MENLSYVRLFQSRITLCFSYVCFLRGYISFLFCCCFCFVFLNFSFCLTLKLFVERLFWPFSRTKKLCFFSVPRSMLGVFGPVRSGTMYFLEITFPWLESASMRLLEFSSLPEICLYCCKGSQRTRWADNWWICDLQACEELHFLALCYGARERDPLPFPNAAVRTHSA